MEKFIMTQDTETARQLKDAGYVPLCDSNGTFLFENTQTSKLIFSELKPGSYVFTNKMLF